MSNEQGLEYTLAVATIGWELVAEVDALIKKGWRPQGGPFVHDGVFYQAVIKLRPPTLPDPRRISGNLD